MQRTNPELVISYINILKDKDNVKEFHAITHNEKQEVITASTDSQQNISLLDDELLDALGIDKSKYESNIDLLKEIGLKILSNKTAIVFNELDKETNEPVLQKWKLKKGYSTEIIDDYWDESLPLYVLYELDDTQECNISVVPFNIIINKEGTKVYVIYGTESAEEEQFFLSRIKNVTYSKDIDSQIELIEENRLPVQSPTDVYDFIVIKKNKLYKVKGIQPRFNPLNNQEMETVSITKN